MNRAAASFPPPASPMPLPPGRGIGRVRRACAITLRTALRLAWWTPVLTLLWPDRPWELDLLAHFAPHCSVIVLLVALLLVRFRRTRRLGREGLIAGLAMLALTLAAHLGPTRQVEPAGSTVRLRLVVFNTDAQRSSRDFLFYTWLKDQQADIVVIIDPPPNIDGEANWLFDAYPYRHRPEPGYMWAVKIYSRLPMTTTPLTTPSERVTFSFAAHRAQTVTLPDDSRFLLSAMHPVSPRKRSSIQRAINSVELDGTLIRQWVEGTGRPAVLVGDFNSTPTGRVHRALAKSSGLRTYPSFLCRGTWPSAVPTWLGVAIDRVWTTPDARIARVEVGPHFQSGHRPVVVELDVPCAATASESPSGPDR